MAIVTPIRCAKRFPSGVGRGKLQDHQPIDDGSEALGAEPASDPTIVRGQGTAPETRRQCENSGAEERGQNHDRFAPGQRGENFRRQTQSENQ